jgi:hypothetical protein
MRPTLALAALIAAPALADGPSRERPDCYCRGAAGERYEMGERTCLTINGRSFTARCEMAQNVTIWRDTGEGCVTG